MGLDAKKIIIFLVVCARKYLPLVNVFFLLVNLCEGKVRWTYLSHLSKFCLIMIILSDFHLTCRRYRHPFLICWRSFSCVCNKNIYFNPYPSHYRFVFPFCSFFHLPSIPIIKICDPNFLAITFSRSQLLYLCRVFLLR